MRRRTPHRSHDRPFASIFLLMVLLAALPFASGASPRPTPASADRPARVPAEYVVTPSGYFHPSCVNAIGADEQLLRDGRVRNADGSFRSLAPCAFAHYAKEGRALAPNQAVDIAPPGATPPPALNGYLVAGYFVDPTHPPSRVDANMIVPTAPADAQDQTIYLFPGLVDYENEQTILQPVLAWNGFQDHAWTIASWNCCVDGRTNYSTPVNVDSGDVIAGSMRGSGCSAGICANWSIVSTDQNSGQATTLATTADGQRFDWVFGAALEVYGVSTCAQLPASGQAAFEAIDALDMSGVNSYGTYPWVAWFPANVIFIDGFEQSSGNCPYELQFYGTPPSSSLRISWTN